MRRWTTSTTTDEADVADPDAMAQVRLRSPPTSNWQSETRPDVTSEQVICFQLTILRFQWVGTEELDDQDACLVHRLRGTGKIQVAPFVFR